MQSEIPDLGILAGELDGCASRQLGFQFGCAVNRPSTKPIW
jgi:hypothetical protein